MANANNVKQFIKRVCPPPILKRIKTANFAILKYKDRYIGRPVTYFEGAKANDRRTREGLFEKYCNGNGLDIGYGGDILCDNCQGFDL